MKSDSGNITAPHRFDKTELIRFQKRFEIRFCDCPTE